MKPVARINKRLKACRVGGRLVRSLCLIAVASVTIPGCAPMISGAMNMTVTPETISEKTAKYFGVAAGTLSISNIEKSALATSYQVRTAGKLYNCTIYYGDVQCKQPGT